MRWPTGLQQSMVILVVFSRDFFPELGAVLDPLIWSTFEASSDSALTEFQLQFVRIVAYDHCGGMSGTRMDLWILVY